jgi:hypothetical protein
MGRLEREELIEFDPYDGMHEAVSNEFKSFSMWTVGRQ